MRTLILAILTSFTLHSMAAEHSVGSQPGCDFSDLDDAVNGASSGDILRLRAEVFVDVITIDKSLELIGGHTNCGDTSPDFLSSSTIENPILGTSPIVSVAAARIVVLRKLNLQGAKATGKGGGLYVGNDAQVTLDRMLIRDNEADQGGGIYVDNRATLTDAGSLALAIEDNVATSVGGGLYVDSAAQVTLGANLLRIAGNASDNAGGGIYVSGNAGITLQGAEIENNESSGSSGGGLYSGSGVNDVTLTLIDCLVTGNSGSQGGGLQILSNIGAMKTLEVTGGAFNNNVATSNGGALNASADVRVTMMGTVFSGNAATFDGGAIASNGADITINGGSEVDAQFEANMAERGGAIFVTGASSLRFNATFAAGRRTYFEGNGAEFGGGIFASGASEVTVFGNTQWSNNTALSSGGGIYITGAGSELTALGWSQNSRNVLFSGNSAQSNGGGLYVDGSSVDIKGAQFGIQSMGNTADNGGGLFATNGASVLVYNSEFISNTALFNGGGLFAGPATQIAIGARLTGESDPVDVSVCDPTTQLADRYCSSFVGNQANITGGAIYSTFNTVDISQTAFSENASGSGGNAIEIAQGATATVDHILVSDHQQAIDVADGAQLTLDYSTVAANTTSGVRASDSTSTELTVSRSIVWDNGLGLDIGSQTTFIADCVISQTPGLSGAIVTDPLFTSTDRGDFRLEPTSPAVDLCSTMEPVLDLDGTPRPLGGAPDAGAFEVFVDGVFANGFEGES